jgi:hypothetical protein
VTGAEPKPKRELRQVRYQRKIERLNAKSAELEAERAELEAKRAELEAKIAELEAKIAEEQARLREMTPHVALLCARRGDWAPLADFIKNGGEISDPIRDFLVAVLQGKKRPNNRAPSLKTYMKKGDVLFFIMEEERRGEKRARAVEKAEAKFGCTSRAIYGYLAEAGLTRKKKT